MFKAFTWMFKTENITKHSLIILLVYCVHFGLSFIGITQRIPIACTLSLIPLLYIMGYFWNLTENIISRETDVQASNIYDGKIKNVYIITLPQLSVFKNTWRGLSFIIASVLLVLPFLLLYFCVLKQGSLIPIYTIITFVFVFLFAPAMLWNYAYRNSIISVWNIRKVIYIMGNYFWSYIGRVALLVLAGLTSYLIELGFIKIINYSASTLLPTASTQITNLTSLDIFATILIALACGVKFIYFAYVYVYLLGTIAPSSEA